MAAFRVSLLAMRDDVSFKYFFQSTEERKIIYIGGLEEAATKDEIRRKFLNYGSIKKISLHVKEDG